MTIDDFNVLVATEEHTQFAQTICDRDGRIRQSPRNGYRQTYGRIRFEQMRQGKAVIAFHKDGTWAGFSYIESWGHGDYVANSGLIINPKFRKLGLARRSRPRRFPLAEDVSGSEAFRLTTGMAVMKINSELGLPPCHLFRADRRRPVLERMRELRELFDPAEQGT